MEQACLAVTRARKLLLRPNPKSLEECREALDSAREILAECPGKWQGHPDPELRAQAGRLNLAVVHAAYLLARAAEHHGRWFHILRSRTAGYTARGEAGEISGPPRLMVRG